MKRHAIFVDAGYVFAQGSVSLLGHKSDRKNLKLNEVEIVAQLKALAASQSRTVEILRVYWYDGARNGATVDHQLIASMPDVKLRLGWINSAGEQKEVDSLLVTDLIELARNQSICNATIVASDIDIRIAVQIAQSFGVRIHLVGLEPTRVSQSPLLRQEVDTVHEIAKADVSKFLSVVAQQNVQRTPTIAVVSAPVHAASAPLASKVAGKVKGEAEKDIHVVIDSAIKQTLANDTTEDLERLAAVLSNSKQVPAEYDGRLLGTCRALLGRNLTGDERREMRLSFLNYVLKPLQAVKS
ncbi:MAG TPA: NYN domain-containing protein [Acidobacteriaceae bacterium]|jgi:uncharacterized LabA/DUF88 family protein|nr:NYN domain-containing protein [Acidobacteriaceae bacterium]